jgi:hypothetical protein
VNKVVLLVKTLLEALADVAIGRLENTSRAGSVLIVKPRNGVRHLAKAHDKCLILGNGYH